MHDFLRVLYEDHQHSLLNFATRLTGDRAAAEDVVQETFFRAWRHPESFADGTSARGWLITVARNVVIDRVRAKTVRPHVHRDRGVSGRADGDGEVTDALCVVRATPTVRSRLGPRTAACPAHSGPPPTRSGRRSTRR